jgi:hypothetical protein
VAKVEATTTDAGVMAQPTGPRTENSLPALIYAAGPVVMTVPKSMIEEHVTTNYKDTKIQQLQLQMEMMYINCYLKATALLLSILERMKSQQLTRLLFYFLYKFLVYIGTSLNLSSMICSSTS